MKGPTRPAPSVPRVNRYSPVTNWNDDPFGADVFEPMPQQKKKPPPRPPPPKLPQTHPEIPPKPSHFIRRPTVLSAILARRKPNDMTPNVTDNTELDAGKLFQKCESKSSTGTLIDLSSPPSSPTFTTRSSSDGLSIDSFGSDLTSNPTTTNGNASQAESGFEDDFDLFMNNRKKDNIEDPFSPPIQKPVLRKVNKDYMDLISNKNQSIYQAPTIIRAKPVRPRPPKNLAILQSTFGNAIPITTMTVNTTKPIQKIGSARDTLESRNQTWDDEPCEREDREPSPPMPTIPPPPPPQLDCDDPTTWPDLVSEPPTWPDLDSEPVSRSCSVEKPYGIALYEYCTGHVDDLRFTVNTRIELVRRVNEEWLEGRLQNGTQGLFPANYIEIKVPLPGEGPKTRTLGTALVMYSFQGGQPGDLPLIEGKTVSILDKINDEWYYGECEGVRGQFPANYVQNLY